MNRRQLLHALSIGALTAGCLGASDEQSPTDTTTDDQSSPSATQTERPTSTHADPTATETSSGTESSDTATDTETDTRTQTTSEPVCTGGGETRLELGESYELGEWVITPQSVELTDTYRLDQTDRVYEFEDDRKLLIVETELQNTGEYRSSWAGGKFQFVRDSCETHPSVTTFQGTDGTEVYISELYRVEHNLQFYAQGYPVEAGETGRVWQVAVVPDSVTLSQVELGLDLTRDREVPVRWVLQS